MRLDNDSDFFVLRTNIFAEKSPDREVAISIAYIRVLDLAWVVLAPSVSRLTLFDIYFFNGISRAGGQVKPHLLRSIPAEKVLDQINYLFNRDNRVSDVFLASSSASVSIFIVLLLIFLYSRKFYPLRTIYSVCFDFRVGYQSFFLFFCIHIHFFISRYLVLSKLGTPRAALQPTVIPVCSYLIDSIRTLSSGKNQ